MEHLTLSVGNVVSSYRSRLQSVMRKMDDLNIGALVLSIGADLPWLSGYQAMPLERLTALVVRKGEQPVLVVPGLESPRVTERGDLFSLRPWHEYEDPFEIVSRAIGDCEIVAVSDRMWASALIALQSKSDAKFVPSSLLTRSLRSIKDPVEIELLREAAARTDRVAESLLKGEIRLIGRSEREISMEISERLIGEGLRKVNFAIVGSGPHSASPHHDPGKRVIGPNEAVVCDFGGEFAIEDTVGYCSDVTRTLVTGEMPERFQELYEVLLAAQAKQLDSIRAGISCQSLDRIGRNYIEEYGYGEYFIHRTGHGIGIEEHEEPYIVEGNSASLVPGNAFSVEPGIYIPNLYGARIEDIAVVTEGGSEVLNSTERTLHQVA